MGIEKQTNWRARGWQNQSLKQIEKNLGLVRAV